MASPDITDLTITFINHKTVFKFTKPVVADGTNPIYSYQIRFRQNNDEYRMLENFYSISPVNSAVPEHHILQDSTNIIKYNEMYDYEIISYYKDGKGAAGSNIVQYDREYTYESITDFELTLGDTPYATFTKPFSPNHASRDITEYLMYYTKDKSNWTDKDHFNLSPAKNPKKDPFVEQFAMNFATLDSDTIYFTKIITKSPDYALSPSNIVQFKTNPSNHTTPNAPRNLTVTQVNDTTVKLDWIEPQTPPEFVSYSIQRRPLAGGDWFNLVPNTNNKNLTYTDGGLNKGDLAEYRVAALNDSGIKGKFSNIANNEIDVPSSPQNLTLVVTSSIVFDLSWIAPVNDGGKSITDYPIEKNLNGEGWKPITKTASTDLSYSDTTITEGDTAEYRVSATNLEGTSIPSNIVTGISPIIPKNGDLITRFVPIFAGVDDTTDTILGDFPSNEYENVIVHSTDGRFTKDGKSYVGFFITARKITPP